MVRGLVFSTPFKIAAAYAVLFLTSTTVLLIFIFFESQSKFEKQLRDRLRAESKSLIANLSDNGIARLRGRLSERLKVHRDSGLYYALNNSNAERLAGNLPEMHFRVGWHETMVRDEPEDPDDLEQTTLTLLGTELSDGSLLVVGARRKHAEDLQEIIVGVAGLGLGLAALLAVSGGILMSRTVLNRLSQINQATDRIVDGDLAERLPVSGTGDEIDQLSENINAMLVRIEQLMATTKQVSSDIAHELRTPLTRLVQSLEKTMSQPDAPIEQKAIGEHVIAELADVLDTFDALLRIGQLDARASGASIQALDLSALVSDLADTYDSVAAESGHTLRSCVAQGIHFNTDRQLLSQLLSNLIENAIKHCQPGSEIRLQLQNENGRPILTLADDGPGIPECERDKVFRPFYRLDGCSNREGKGLGLALVEAISRQLKIDIELGDNHPGLIVKLIF